MYEGIQGKSILVRVSEGSSRESTVYFIGTRLIDGIFDYKRG